MQHVCQRLIIFTPIRIQSILCSRAYILSPKTTTLKITVIGKVYHGIHICFFIKKFAPITSNKLNFKINYLKIGGVHNHLWMPIEGIEYTHNTYTDTQTHK